MNLPVVLCLGGSGVFFSWLMKRTPLACLCFLLCSSWVQANPGLDFINRARVANKLPPLVAHRQLQQAAQNHANYMSAHKFSGHRERKGQSGFTGVWCSERVAHAGYASRYCVENLSSGQDSWQSSAEDLMSAIYHRLGFLDFDVDEIGYAQTSHPEAGLTKNYFSYVMGSSPLRKMCSGNTKTWGVLGMCRNKDFVVEEKLYEQKQIELAKKGAEKVVYPWPGQDNVYPAFVNQESPDPLPGIFLSGQPVSVQFNPVRMKGRQVTVTGFRLEDSSGRDIPLLPRKDMHTDDQRRFSEFEYAWFPVKALGWGKTYKAYLSFTINNSPKQFDWSFTTQKTPFSLSKKAGELMIDHPVKSIRLTPNREYSLVLSPELSSSRINKLEVTYTGECHHQIEAFNTISIRQRGSSTVTITLADGHQYVIKVTAR